MNKKYLTLKEQWEIDLKAAKDGGTFKVLIPQCEECKYWVKGNAEQCKQYISEKPEMVLFCEKECPKFEHANHMMVIADETMKQQLYGGVFGFCVGDALGVPVEFTSRLDRKKDPVQEMRAYGTHHQYFGTWSDDSSLTLCLIDSLIKGYNISDIAEKFCKFYYEGYWTPHNQVFDIGNTTTQAIKRIKVGIKPIECGANTERDNGNGALMRILPLAFVLISYLPSTKIRIIEEVSALTHAHKRSKLACIIYIEYVVNLLKKKNKIYALMETIDFIKKYCINEYCNEFINFERILNASIMFLDESEINSSGYVVDTLEAALWAFLTTNTYSSAVFRAINLGGDTDTIGAIAGGLAGIVYGIESISDNWIQCLARKEEIYDLLSDFNSILL